MNIIFHRYNSICEPDYIDAFKALGLEVIEEKAEMEEKNIPLDKRVEILGELILTRKPIFVFSINFFPYIAMMCEKLKCMYVCVSVDCPVVELFSQAVQSPYNRIFLFDYQQYLDVREINEKAAFHLPLGGAVSRIDRTIGKPEFCSIDYNQDLIQEGWIQNNNCKNIYKYDVSFIGSLYNEKDPFEQVLPSMSPQIRGYCDGIISAQRLFNGQEIIEALVTQELIDEIKKHDRNFYPSDFNVVNTDKFVVANNYLSYHLTHLDRIEALNKISNMAELHLFTRSDTKKLNGVNIHGGVSSLTEMPRVFRESKINLNMTMRAIKTGLPQRIWDVLASRGFLLTNYQVELGEELEIGKHLVAYENIDEACELIDYYLKHDDEREEIADAGYLAVRDRFTVINRAEMIIKAIFSSIT